MGKPIIWKARPLKQVRELQEYFFFELGSSQFFINFLARLNKDLKLISEFPESGRPTGRKNVRYVNLGDKRSVFYRIHLNHISILLIWDSRWNPDKNPYKN